MDQQTIFDNIYNNTEAFVNSFSTIYVFEQWLHEQFAEDLEEFLLLCYDRKLDKHCDLIIKVLNIKAYAKGKN